MYKVYALLFCLLAGVNAGFAQQVAEEVARLAAGDVKAAKVLADKTIKRDKQNTNLVAAMGEAFLKAGRLEEAKHYYEQSRHCHKITTRSICLGADIALAEKDIPTAEMLYNRAIYFNECDTMAYYKYADMMAQRQPDSAISHLQRLRKLVPSRQTDLRLAKAYYDSNNFAKAAETYDSIGVDALGEKELTNMTMALFMDKQFQRSYDIAKDAHSKRPRSAVFNRMMLYNATDMKQYADALDAADALFNRSDSATLQYLDYIYYGYALHGSGRHDEAIAQFGKALQLNPDRADVVEATADAYDQVGRYDEAISYYRKYMAMLKDKSDYENFKLARLCYHKGTDERLTKELTTEKRAALNEADQLLAGIISRNPNNATAHLWRARTVGATDPDMTRGTAKPHYEAAAQLLEQQGKDVGKLNECYRYLAFYYYQKKQTGEALQYAEKILKITPGDDFATRLKQALSQ